MMVRISFKLIVLIVSSLGFAAYLSWTNEYVAPYRNPQEPFKQNGRVDGGKRETHNESNDEDINPKLTWQQHKLDDINSHQAEGSQETLNDEDLNPKLAWQQHKLDNVNLQQAEESQETSNQRSDSKYGNTPQLNELKAEISDNKAVQSSQGIDAERVTAVKQEERIQTFFSTLPTGFLQLGIEANQEIDTQDFLLACRDLAPFLDKFGKTTMSMARQDLTNNALKINAVYEADPDASHTLQHLVLTEFENGDFEVDGKGTISLLWLKRGLEFLAEFLQLLSEGEEPSQAANTAYDNCLYQHHGYFIRASFKLGVKTLPYRTDFIKTLAVNQEDASDLNFDQIVSEDMAKYTKGLQHVLQILREFYTMQGLDN